MTDTPQDSRTVLPLVEERVRVEKRIAPTARVLVGTRVEERQTWVSEDLEHDEVVVEREPIGKPIEAMPDIRQEGEVTIYPVVEEVLVVEKRLILKEEVRVSRRRSVEHVKQPITLRSTRAVVERRPVEQVSPPETE